MLPEWITSFFNGFLRLFEGNTEIRILLVGLDGAGKTTLTYKVKLGEIVPSSPTIGFNTEQIQYKNLTLNIYDVGGQDKVRGLWYNFLNNTDVIIFVIDSNDRDRMDEVKFEIGRCNQHEHLNNVPFLFFANKQDITNALNPTELIDLLDLNSLSSKRQWFIQPCSVITSDNGIYQGFEWISNVLRNKK